MFVQNLTSNFADSESLHFIDFYFKVSSDCRLVKISIISYTFKINPQYLVDNPKNILAALFNWEKI